MVEIDKERTVLAVLVRSIVLIVSTCMVLYMSLLLLNVTIYYANVPFVDSRTKNGYIRISQKGKCSLTQWA